MTIVESCITERPSVPRKASGRIKFGLTFAIEVPENRRVSGSYAARLANLVLPDVDGQTVRLGGLWNTHPAVVVFLRHYG